MGASFNMKDKKRGKYVIDYGSNKIGYDDAYMKIHYMRKQPSDKYVYDCTESCGS